MLKSLEHLTVRNTRKKPTGYLEQHCKLKGMLESIVANESYKQLDVRNIMFGLCF